MRPGWLNLIVLTFVVASALALISCGTDQGTPQAAASDAPRTILVNAAAAAEGSIAVRASYTAAVTPSEQVNLSPLTTGRIDKLLVDIGSEVKRGQLIAELTRGTLDVQLQQAELSLKQAQTRLRSLTGATGTQLGVARAQLDQLLKPTAADVQAATSAVTTAQATVDSAKTRLAQLLKPAASDVQAATSAVTTAQATVDSAKTRLAQLLKPTASDVQAATSAVTTAQATLESAKIRLTQLLTPTALDIASSRAAVTAAEATWRAAVSKFDTTIAAQLQLRIASEIRNLLVALTSARSKYLVDQNTLLNLLQPSAREPTSTELAAAQRSVADSQAQVDAILASLGQVGALPSSFSADYASERSAQVALDLARARLNDLLTPSSTTVALADNAVRTAQGVLDAAKAKLSDLQSPDPTVIAVAENTVKSAQAALDSAKAKLNDLQSPDPNTIAVAETSVKSAQAAVEATQARLDLLKNPSPASMAAAQSAVTTAEDAIAAAQSAVDLAQAQINLVKEQIALTTVYAPLDGVITQRFLATGAIATAQSAIVAIASKGTVISANVEEAGAVALTRGQTITLTSPARPGQPLQLPIAVIAPTADSQAHTFSVQIRDDTGATGLRPGMSASITIENRRQNAVLVPKEAVVVREGQASVYVVDGGIARLRKVAVGLTDERQSEIRTGVKSGEQVIVTPPPVLSDGDAVTVRVQPAPQGQGGRPSGAGQNP